MGRLVRFGIAIDGDLLAEFDARVGGGYRNRSEAIRDLIRERLVEREWEESGEVAGAITIVYNHHRRELLDRIMDIEHDCHGIIISTTHVHLDHHNCLETAVVRGKSEDVRALFTKLRSLKGVKHATISRATTGRSLG